MFWVRIFQEEAKTSQIDSDKLLPCRYQSMEELMCIPPINLQAPGVFNSFTHTPDTANNLR